MKQISAFLLVLAACVWLAGCQDETVTPAPQPASDDTPPTATILPLNEQQVSLRFELEFEAEDDASGVAYVEIMVRTPDGFWESLGNFTESPGVFVASGPGLHAFSAVAVDSAGNQQETPDNPQAETVVPEPIIITDRTGEEFDITNAVLRYSLMENGWGHGLGRHSIVPVVDPEWWVPGESGYPDTFNVSDVIALVYEGDSHAYRIGNITDREVVNDSFGDVHLAVTY